MGVGKEEGQKVGKEVLQGLFPWTVIGIDLIAHSTGISYR